MGVEREGKHLAPERGVREESSLQVHHGLGGQDEPVVEDVEEGDHHQDGRGGLGRQLALAGQHHQHHHVNESPGNANYKTGVTPQQRIQIFHQI